MRQLTVFHCRAAAEFTRLVTVPLGVLKANTISFVPDLPEKKQDAIDNMGYGLLNKAIMYWNNEDDIVWPDDERIHMFSWMAGGIEVRKKKRIRGRKRRRLPSRDGRARFEGNR